MTIRIPIIGQSTTTAFVPQQSVQAIQIADPRGEALQGLGKGIGEFADGFDKYGKAQSLKQAAANDTTESHPAIAFKTDQDNNAWTLQAYAQCVRHGSDLTAHLAGISTPGDGAYPAADSVIASANAGADTSPLAHPATLLSTPNPIQAIITGLMPGGSAGGGNPGNPDPAANAPSPTDPAVHGTTGAWINGYDLGARAAIAAAPSKSVADSLAAQCGTDRLQGARAIMGLEAKGNVQQRQSTALSAAQTIATYGVAADPATLPQALAFFQRHPIRIEGSAADQASFDAGLRQTLVGAGIKTLLARDPQGTLRQLQGGAGEEGAQGEAGTNGEPDPAAALHPAIAALTPEERMGYLPQARAAVYVAQGKAQADVAQRTTAAIAPGANAAPPPALPEFISAYGAQRGTQLHSEMTDKLSQNQYRQNFAALPSAEVERARNDAQAGLHATARANADILGTPASADTGTDGNDSAFTLRTQADVADPHYAAQSREATNLQSAAAAILNARAQDPVQAGIDAGAFGLKPADMSTPQAALASAATRAPVAGVIADTYNTGRVAFSNSEFADLGKTVATMPPQERGPFFKQLADSLGDPELVRATFKRLGTDNPVLAAAAQMQYEEQANQPGAPTAATGVISAPEHMFRGVTALNPTDGSPPQAMPADAQTRAAFMPREGENAGAAETRYQATRAIYASLAKDDDDKSGKFDAKRWQVAQNLATDGSGTAGEVGLGPDMVASSRLSESGTPVGNQLHADLERVMRGKNPFQEGDGAPVAAQSGAMDILDPDKPNPTLAKHDENPVQLAFNTTGQEFTGDFGGAPFSTAPEPLSDGTMPSVAEPTAPAIPASPAKSPENSSLKLGVNARHANSLLEAGKLIGEPPETVATLVDVEADRWGMHEKFLQRKLQDYFFPNGSPDSKTLAAKKKTREWQEKYLEQRDTWNENGKESGGHTKAVGLTQMTPPAWTQEAETRGSYLNQVAVNKGLVDSHNKVIPEKNAELMGLRVDPKLSIIAGAQYAKHIYQHVLDKQDPANPVIPSNLSSDERAYFLYICHHEGMTNALPFLQGTLSEKRSSLELYQNISSSEASALIKSAGSAQAAYKEWLTNMAKTRVNPGKFRN